MEWEVIMMALPRSMTIGRVLIVLLATASLAVGSASAQTYPNKPIRIIVAFAPGGPADVMARLIAQRMPQILGQSLIIENKPGAGGTIGARAAADSDPDGYTLLLGNTSTLVISPAVYRNIGYDPVKAFVPVAMLGVTANMLVVNPALPVKSVRELIALAKRTPGKLNYSSPGAGTPPHLIGEMFKLRTGSDIVHVPYKGGGLAMQAVIAGEVQMAFENTAVSLPYVAGGQVRGLAFTSEKRNPQAPDIPTMIEAGVADFVSASFTGIVAPAGTPAAIVGRLNAAINETLKTPDVQATLIKLSVEARFGSPEDFSAFLAGERAKWVPLVKSANIKAE
jgi:tripartite-type tricarboxylate transporter receptor subunit TctC